MSHASNGGANAAETHAYDSRSYARRVAGWALEGFTRRQKQAADVLGITQPNVSRQIAGEQDGDVSRFYAIIERAVEGGRARAGRLIAGAFSAAQGAAEGLTRTECRRGLDEAIDRETVAQHTEDEAQNRVLRAIGRCGSEDATPDDLHELAAAVEAHDLAICEETAAHAEVLYYARGLIALTKREARS